MHSQGQLRYEILSLLRKMTARKIFGMELKKKHLRSVGYPLPSRAWKRVVNNNVYEQKFYLSIILG
jgi:hypothetical protein